MIEISKQDLDFLSECEIQCKKKFNEIEQIEFENQLKVLNAFNKNDVQAYHFIGSSG